MKRQVRIYVNGKFQFAVTTHQDEPLGAVADRAAEVMGFKTYRAGIAPGLIDILTQ